MDSKKLKEIIDTHGKWLRNEEGGECANLRYADLHSVDLHSVDLHSADLHSADLHSVDLHSVDLHSANLHSANLRYANLRYANLHSANLHSVDLHSANLRYANLRYANLHSANLRYANLRYADLSSANLRYANLHSAKGIKPEWITPLLIMLDQPGKLHAYKLVNECNEGPYNGGITYEMNGEYSVDVCNESINEQCGAGINLATLDWCLREWREGFRVLIAEFTADDIACIPTATDGKFRVKRCKIVGEKDVSDLVARGE